MQFLCAYLAQEIMKDLSGILSLSHPPPWMHTHSCDQDGSCLAETPQTNPGDPGLAHVAG